MHEFQYLQTNIFSSVFSTDENKRGQMFPQIYRHFVFLNALFILSQYGFVLNDFKRRKSQ